MTVGQLKRMEKTMIPGKRVLCVWVCAAVLAALLSGCSVKKLADFRENYLQAYASVVFPDYALFPQKEALSDTVVNDYQSVTISTLFFDDVYFLLSCTYSDSEFNQEVDRLQTTGAEYRKDLFRYPAYVMLYSGIYYEYALVEEQTNAIVYVYVQGSFVLLEDFPVEYRPHNAKNVDICHYESQ